MNSSTVNLSEMSSNSKDEASESNTSNTDENNELIVMSKITKNDVNDDVRRLELVRDIVQKEFVDLNLVFDYFTSYVRHFISDHNFNKLRVLFVRGGGVLRGCVPHSHETGSCVLTFLRTAGMLRYYRLYKDVSEAPMLTLQQVLFDGNGKVRGTKPHYMDRQLQSIQVEFWREFFIAEREKRRQEGQKPKGCNTEYVDDILQEEDF